jgi:hypothetical protein
MMMDWLYLVACYVLGIPVFRWLSKDDVADYRQKKENSEVTPFVNTAAYFLSPLAVPFVLIWIVISYKNDQE